MVEQAALDAGRMTMAWLLVGLPEPNWAIIEKNQVRRTIRPFSKLARPAWMAANLAFLKDLDYMETRLKDNKIDKPLKEPEDTNPSGDPKPKKKAKGKSKGKSTSTSAEEKGQE